MTSQTCPSTPTGPLTISGPSTLSRPTPSTFVKRSGSRLTLDGESYRIVGPNIYWLGLDENVVPNPSYPSRGRVLEVMAIASVMGATTIRSTTLGVSVGTSLSVQPSFGKFNTDALDVISFAVYAARMYGLRLVIPLVDQYDYYHGGKLTFLRWRNVSTSDTSVFYDVTSPVFDDFKTYIGTLLNYTNNITNIPLRNDPTILAWETGNELDSPPREWTSQISSFIKSLAPDQLVVSGTYGVKSYELDIDTVDIYSNHFYPPYASKLRSDYNLVSSHNKVYLAGEFDWTDKWHTYTPLLAAIIPLVLALGTFFLPRRWFPWTFTVPLPRRRKNAVGPTYEGLNKPGQMGMTTRQGLRVTVRWWWITAFFVLWIPLVIVIALFSGPSTLGSFLGQIEDTESGDLYWSLFGRDNSCCQYVQHNDGFTAHYPGDSNDMKSRIRPHQTRLQSFGSVAALCHGRPTRLLSLRTAASSNSSSPCRTGFFHIVVVHLLGHSWPSFPLGQGHSIPMAFCGKPDMC